MDAPTKFCQPGFLRRRNAQCQWRSQRLSRFPGELWIESDRATVNRLKAGLPIQEDAIRRTERALEAAKEDRAEAREDAQLAAIKGLNPDRPCMLPKITRTL